MTEMFKMPDGRFVASLIKGSRYYGGNLILKCIDTVSYADSEFLYDLRTRVWHGPIEVSSLELCEALQDVYEVWILYFWWVADADCGLLIEDGTIFENTL